MKKKLALTITMTMTAVMSMQSSFAYDQVSDAQSIIATQKDEHSGKCASGKCGFEKLYGKAKAAHDPQGYLVRARDGQCGLSGEGIAVEQEAKPGLCASGVCGQ